MPRHQCACKMESVAACNRELEAERWKLHAAATGDLREQVAVETNNIPMVHK